MNKNMAFSRFSRGRFNRFRRSNNRFSSSSNRFRSRRSRVLGGRRKVNPMLLTSKNKTDAKLNLPITPRYLTKFSYGFTGRYAAAGQSDGRFVLKLNSPFTPGGYTASGATYTFTGSGGVLVSPTSDLTTLQSAGFEQLCNNNFYRRYRVGASSINVTCQPTAEADTILMTVVPIPGNLTVNLGSFDSAATRAQNLPFSKERICTKDNNVKQNTIRNYVDVPSIEGKKKSQVVDDDQYQSQYNDNPTQINLWLVSWQTVSGANLSAPLHFNVQSIYYTELSELTYPTQQGTV